MRIGVDVGGTNTDAVLMAGGEILAEVKTATTPDVTTGVAAALRGLRRGHRWDPDAVQAVVIGTTHFVNAVVQARGLAPTAVVRLGVPATSALPPLVDWPDRLRTAIGGHGYLCHGGHEFDGRRIGALNEAELAAVAEDLERRGTRAVAITSVFSPVDASMERHAARVLTARLPHLQISLSSEIGRMGLLERENATAINACLGELAGHIADALGDALDAAGLTAPLFLTQNNGTLMDIEFARRYPVATFASGPTNSLRGAAFLSGLTDCVVVDIGGTTTDIGVLAGGFPREAPGEVCVAGVRTNFRMPQLISHDIGGGSIVRLPTRAAGEAGTAGQRRDGLPAAHGHGGSDLAGMPVAVGPDSVGNQLVRRAVVFGGDILTATDLAVAAGYVEIGDAALVADVGPDTAAAVLDGLANGIATSILRLRASPEPLPVVLVGGGCVLLRNRLPMMAEVLRPAHFMTANAIGAAIAEPGGEVERIFSLTVDERDRVLDRATAEATAQAVAAGAQPGSVRVVEADEAPITYLPGNATWVRVRTLGTLSTPERHRGTVDSDG